jgi:uncharacterized protein (TIGR03066 family)
MRESNPTGVRVRLVLAVLLATGTTGLTVAADDVGDATELLTGVWTQPGAKRLKVEFTKDGKYAFTSEDKSFKTRSGTFKVVGKEKVEVAVTSGLVKGEKAVKKTVTFTVTKDKLWFDPGLSLVVQPKDAPPYVRASK